VGRTASRSRENASRGRQWMKYPIGHTT
jgi:hypothetical protein